MNDNDKILSAVVLLHTEVLALRRYFELAHPEIKIPPVEVRRIRTTLDQMMEFRRYATRHGG